jgi:hypothetical protein
MNHDRAGKHHERDSSSAGTRGDRRGSERRRRSGGAGDEAAFLAVVNRYSGALLRVALVVLTDRAKAEEIVQETWLAVLRGIDRFEGRSSLKTWIFRMGGLVEVSRHSVRIRRPEALRIKAAGAPDGLAGTMR